MCDRSQSLRSHAMHLSRSVIGSEILGAADHDNGAVIFGGRRLHKSLGGCEDSEAQGISGGERDDHTVTSVMQKMREMLGKRF